MPATSLAAAPAVPSRPAATASLPWAAVAFAGVHRDTQGHVDAVVVGVLAVVRLPENRVKGQTDPRVLATLKSASLAALSQLGKGCVYDGTAVGSPVYVNGDPVNLVDPNGHKSCAPSSTNPDCDLYLTPDVLAAKASARASAAAQAALDGHTGCNGPHARALGCYDEQTKLPALSPQQVQSCAGSVPMAYGIVAQFRALNSGEQKSLGQAISSNPACGGGVGVFVVLAVGAGGSGAAPLAGLPTPLKADGTQMTKQEFNELVMKWGSGDQDALDRAQTLTRADLEQGGVTPEIAAAWRNGYLATIAKDWGSPSAAGRTVLMQRAYDLLTTDDPSALPPLPTSFMGGQSPQEERAQQQEEMTYGDNVEK